MARCARPKREIKSPARGPASGPRLDNTRARTVTPSTMCSLRPAPRRTSKALAISPSPTASGQLVLTGPGGSQSPPTTPRQAARHARRTRPSRRARPTKTADPDKHADEDGDPRRTRPLGSATPKSPTIEDRVHGTARPTGGGRPTRPRRPEAAIPGRDGTMPGAD